MDYIDELLQREFKIRKKKRDKPYKNEYNKRKQHENTIKNLKEKYFIGLDGEGYTDGKNVHHYTLLCSSVDECIQTPTDLKTIDCLEFFLKLKRKHPNGIFVSFYFSYDVNMMLGDLPPENIAELSDTNQTIIHIENEPDRRIKIKYFPRKFFIISDCTAIRKENGRPGLKYNNTIEIYDVFGFFQSSFVLALKKYNLGVELEKIEKMKAERAYFTNTTDEIKSYCVSECKLLVELMNIVRNGCYELDLYLTRWHGAGALAGAILRKHHVKDHYVQLSSLAKKYVYSSYFGGRIQTQMIGKINAPVFSHDIVSAYPSTLVKLPSLKNCEEYSPEFSFEIPELSPIVYHVKWNIPDDETDFSKINIAPFPWRDARGQIEYPLSGEGYYWHCEVAAAKKIYGEKIKILDSFGYKINSTEKPFDFIENYFQLRKKYKSEGNHTQLVIKLGLNSLYGKTAQGVGYNNQPPPYQNYIYAGLITSHTRARLFTLACQKSESVIAFSTDGLYSLSQHDCQIGTDLGNYEVDKYNDFFIIKPGFYHANGDKGELSKIRGFRKSEVDWQKIYEAWHNMRTMGEIPCHLTQFFGMKNDKSLVKWRKWIDIQKIIYLKPLKGFSMPDETIPGEVERTYYAYRSECSIPYRFTDEYFEKNDRLEDENSSLDEENIL